MTTLWRIHHRHNLVSTDPLGRNVPLALLTPGAYPGFVAAGAAPYVVGKLVAPSGAADSVMVFANMDAIN